MNFHVNNARLILKSFPPDSDVSNLRTLFNHFCVAKTKTQFSQNFFDNPLFYTHNQQP